jgi:hypothetical protein
LYKAIWPSGTAAEDYLKRASRKVDPHCRREKNGHPSPADHALGSDVISRHNNKKHNVGAPITA